MVIPLRRHYFRSLYGPVSSTIVDCMCIHLHICSKVVVSEYHSYVTLKAALPRVFAPNENLSNRLFMVSLQAQK